MAESKTTPVARHSIPTIRARHQYGAFLQLPGRWGGKCWGMSPKGRIRQVLPSIKPTFKPKDFVILIEAAVWVAVCQRVLRQSSRGKRWRASLKEVVASERS